MSEEIKFEYFLDGELINYEDINFNQNLEIRIVGSRVNIATSIKEDENE